MLLHSRQEPGYRFHKGVVIHHRIPLVTLQPGGWIAVMLRQNDGVGIGTFHASAEIPPETVVKIRGMAQIRRHIQPPAVRIEGWRNPFGGNPHDIFIQLPGAFIIQLRQRIMPPPAVISGVIGEPVFVYKSALGIPFPSFINTFPVQPFVKGTAVVEYTVNDNPHASPVGFLHNLNKKLVAGLQVLLIRNTVDITAGEAVLMLPVRQKLPFLADDFPHMGINIIVILYIVFMVGGRYKQGIKINNINPQILQIIHLIQNTLQIPSVKIPYIHLCRICVPVLYLPGFIPDIMILSCEDIIGRIPVAKAIHINLVHYRALCPGRCGKTGDDAEIIMLLRLLDNSS